jgi:transposase
MDQRRVARAQKKWVEEGRTILFADESNFYLLPCVVRTWAAVGETPVIKWQANWNHLSAACAISEQGELWTMTKTKEGTFKSSDVVGFLRYLLASIEGKIGVVWDGVSVHRSKEVKQFLEEEGSEASGRIELVRLPAYAPDLNPAEGIWSYLKCVQMRNFACHNLTHLRYVLTDAFANLLGNTDIVRSCFQQPGCY